MATLVLSAVGGAIGGAIGGSVLGISAAAIGQAIGGTLGRAVDGAVFGPEDKTQEIGKIDSFRVQTAGEGAPISRAFGRVRVPGHVIWSSDFIEVENSQVSGGGGKLVKQPTVTTISYSYFISLAIAVGEGEISRIGRIWADGREIDQSNLNITFHQGSKEQQPDAVIASHEGIENTPAFRGTAYVVIEELPLAEYGNRIPQLNFEVFRQPLSEFRTEKTVQDLIPAVSLIPGSGEYVLATTPVIYEGAFAEAKPANAHSLRGGSNIENSIADLKADLPNCKSVGLVTSWFGDDLRCDRCEIKPKVEFQNNVTDKLPWSVNGLAREFAEEISREDGDPIYGGTPTDQSIVEAIELIKAGDQDVFFYPFVLMDIPQANGLVDPYTGSVDQPKLPWRGRITASLAPGQVGSPDKTNAVEVEIDAFFGQAAISDFNVVGTEVSYTGPEEWSYRRFILHYAHLCAAVGGVAAFSIGSEMRGLTSLRNGSNEFPAVEHLIGLANDVRSILGPEVKIGYAADWSEYFGHQPTDGSGDVFFHLDPLWAHSEIDFVGIDNYMPLSDWRDEPNHLDGDAPSIYDQDYLQSNIEGGEGYDWYYESPLDREIQNRTKITDGAYNQPWIYRYKDIRNWWENQHHNRVGGVQSDTPTNWVPQGKPIWFTELGFGAVDKATNQPNVFIDPKSSESAVPYYSTGEHDAQIQMSAIRAVLDYWQSWENNPRSDVYGAQMIDTNNIFIWAWDARPWPDFPYRVDAWSDGENHRLGHWISGRSASVELSQIVAELSGMSDVQKIDVNILRRMVRGFLVTRPQSARRGIEDLMRAYNFSASECNGLIQFNFLDEETTHTIDSWYLVVEEDRSELEFTRESNLERPNAVSVGFWDADDAYEFAKQDAHSFDETTAAKISYQLPIVMERNDAHLLAFEKLDDHLADKEVVAFTLPPSRSVKIGSVLEFQDMTGPARYRITGEESGLARAYTGERIAQLKTEPAPIENNVGRLLPPAPIAPVLGQLLDLPLFAPDVPEENLVFAATSEPWSGAAIYSQELGGAYQLEATLSQATQFGRVETPISGADPHRLARLSFEVVLSSGGLASVSRLDLLSGKNLFAVETNTGAWELIQFQNAELQASGKYLLSGLLRGQSGTEATAHEDIGIGAQIVFLNGGYVHFNVPDARLNLDVTYRFGPTNLPVSEAAYQDIGFNTKRIASRPFSPAHLRQSSQNGDMSLTWTRRTRGSLDVWNTPDEPLNEVTESYHAKVFVNGTEVRSWTLVDPEVTYFASEMALDGVVSEFEFEVAQVSQIFGAGAVSRKTIYV